MTPEQLKASILQYAVEGKLVKQDPNDEPASELLKKIENEKDQLIEEGKIKKSRKLPAITDEGKPFDIPDNWEWARLEDISTFMSGFAYKSRFYVKSASNQVIRLGNVKNDHLILDNKQVFIDDKYANETNAYKIREGNILFTMTGTRKKRDYFFTLLVNKKDVSKRNLYLNQRVGCLNHIFSVNKKWLNYILKSQTILDEVFINETGTANQGNIGSAKTMRIVLPIPPLEEQKRIVAKIEKLMPLVDEYAESYNRLQKIDNEFEDKLKQSVLHYAMEGKLVKQNPNDEPASELVKASSMEKSHNESYKIPSSWEWVRLGSGVKFINGRAYKKTELLTDSNLTPVLRVGNLFTNSSWYYSDLKLDEDKYIDNGDLIYAWSASFGPRIWNGGHVMYHYHIWKIVIKKSIDKKFLYYFLSDPHNVLGETKLHGSTMKHVTKTNMEKLPFPLPPLEEQRRIVTKIKKIKDSISSLSK